MSECQVPRTTPVVISSVVILLIVMNVGSITAASTESLTVWREQIGNTPDPGAGCFEAEYPSTGWTQVPCAPASDINSSLLVGDGVDRNASAPSGNIIRLAEGGVYNMTGFTSETDKESNGNAGYGPNFYSFQMNSNYFSTSYNGVATRAVQQFVFENNGTSGGKGEIFIVYVLVKYLDSHSSCPSYHSGIKAWEAVDDDCYSNTAATDTAQANPDDLDSYCGLETWANNPSSGMDQIDFCNALTFWSHSASSSILSLYKYWTQAEFNVFGYNGGDNAVFNKGTALWLEDYIYSYSGSSWSQITPSCGTRGVTQETNSLTIDWCTGSSGYLSFEESS